MRFCDICREPATRSGLSLHGDKPPTMKYYCYIHAVAGGLLGGSLALLLEIAAKTGHATNAVVFIVEALRQHGCVIEPDKQRPLWSIPAPSETAERFCIAIRLWTIERFDFHEHLVLNHWKLMRGEDIGLILTRLAQAGVLALEEDHAVQVVENLCALKRELLTFPYDEY